MRKLIFITVLIATLFQSSTTFATVITVDYSVNFDSYSNNTSWFITPPSGFDSVSEQNEYLKANNFYISVMYDTDRTGEIRYTATGDLLRHTAVWAEVISTNIPTVIQNSEFTYNYFGTATRNKGQDRYVQTLLLGHIELAFDFDDIESLKVGAVSDYVDLYNHMAGEYETHSTGYLSKAYNKYRGTAVVESITKVNEPMTIAIFLLSLSSMLSLRKKSNH